MNYIDKLKTIKYKLANNKPTIGTWLQIPSAISAEILSYSKSFEWVCIDLEHSPISIETCENMIRSIDGSGSVPIVRLSSNDETLIKRVMDSGALGIIVPMVSSFDAIKKANEAMHYPPKGKRGVGLARAQKWGDSFEEYKNEVDNNTLLIGQIENKEAIENIDEIFGSGLMDAYIIGPYDLSASYGRPGDFSQKEFISALEKISLAAEKYNVPSGYHLAEPDENKLHELINDGYLFIAYSIDTVLLQESAKINDY